MQYHLLPNLLFLETFNRSVSKSNQTTQKSKITNWEAFISLCDNYLFSFSGTNEQATCTQMSFNST